LSSAGAALGFVLIVIVYKNSLPAFGITFYWRKGNEAF
jgi:hypothetical protein